MMVSGIFDIQEGSCRRMAGRWISERRAFFLACLALPASAQAPAPAMLAPPRFARDVLCPRCDNDIKAEGVNRAMRRVFAARGALEEAERALEAALAQGESPYRAVRPAHRRVRAALEAVAEETAQQALRRAVRIVETIRTDG